MKKIINTLLSIMIMVVIGNAQNAVIETNLQEMMDQSNEEMISVNIILKSQVKTAEIRSWAERTDDREMRQDIIIEGLKKHSAIEQADVIMY